MAEYAADDASDNCAGDIDATGAAVDDLALHPTALLGRPDDGTDGRYRRLVEGFPLPAAVVIGGRRSGSSKALSFVGLALRFRCPDLRRVGLDARIGRVALRGHRGLLAAKARRVLRRRDALVGQHGQRMHVVVPPTIRRKVVGLPKCRRRLLEFRGRVRHHLRIASRCVERQPCVVERGVVLRKRCTA